MASIYAVLFVPALVLFAAKPIRLSTPAWCVFLPLGVLLGLCVFAWLASVSNRGLAANGIELSRPRRLGIATMYAVLSVISGGMMAIALPAVPHRLIGRPVEVRTVITDKVIEHAKHTSYCLVTPPFSERIDVQEWCTDLDRFREARVGETMVLHGTVSWFGFQEDYFDLVPDDPAKPVAFASGGAPLQGPPAAMAAGHPPQSRRLPWMLTVLRPTSSAALPTQVDRGRSKTGGEALRAWPGDDLATLQAAYPDAPAPVPFQSPDRSNRQLVWMPDRGLRFFLTSGGTVNLVRLDAPFAGAVDGIRVGDALAAVQHEFESAGKAIGGQPTPIGRSLLFTSKARYKIRVDLDTSQRVQTILLIR